MDLFVFSSSGLLIYVMVRSTVSSPFWLTALFTQFMSWWTFVLSHFFFLSLWIMLSTATYYFLSKQMFSMFLGQDCCVAHAGLELTILLPHSVFRMLVMHSLFQLSWVYTKERTACLVVELMWLALGTEQTWIPHQQWIWTAISMYPGQHLSM